MNSENKIFKKPVSTNMRIAAHNVLSDDTCASRYDILTEHTAELNADVIAFQEYTPNFYDALNPSLEKLGYTLIVPDDIFKHLTALSHNTTPMFYKADKLDLIACGYKRYDTVPLTKNTSKSYTWGLFETKESKKRFIAMGTHMTWAREDFVPSPYELRRRDAVELLEKAAELKKLYGEDTPVFLMGDFNATPSTDAFKLIAEQYQNSRTCDKIPNKINTDYGTCYALGKYPPKNDAGFIIDHIFFSEGKVAPVQFQHVATDLAVRCSDHLPIALDFDLK